MPSYEFREVIPEFKVNKKRADLVVKTKDNPFLVNGSEAYSICPSRSFFSCRVRKSKMYKDELGIRFYAVYDSWNGLFFEDKRNFLVIVFGPLTDEYHAKNLLIGLAEYAYSGKKETLNRLPRHQDPRLLIRLVLPSMVKIFKEQYAPNALLKV